VKKVVGTRLAMAARAVAYKDPTQIWTGPVLQSCTVKGGSIELTFDPEKLLDDAVMVLDHTVNAIGLSGNDGETFTWDWATLSLLQKLGPESPMEIQLGGSTSGAMDDGLWLPVSLSPKCTPAGKDGAGKSCSLNTSTGARESGWNTVTVPIGGLGTAATNLTGIRCVHPPGGVTTTTHPHHAMPRHVGVSLSMRCLSFVVPTLSRATCSSPCEVFGVVFGVPDHDCCAGQWPR
jgi:hypothetical protein